MFVHATRMTYLSKEAGAAHHFFGGFGFRISATKVPAA